MTELDKNFNDVLDKALETGEKVITIECPCCGKTFYATESEAAYQTIVRNKDDYALDLNKFSGKILGRKCPFCGFSAGLTSGNFFNLGK